MAGIYGMAKKNWTNAAELATQAKNVQGQMAVHMDKKKQATTVGDKNTGLGSALGSIGGAILGNMLAPGAGTAATEAASQAATQTATQAATQAAAQTFSKAGTLIGSMLGGAFGGSIEGAAWNGREGFTSGLASGAASGLALGISTVGKDIAKAGKEWLSGFGKKTAEEAAGSSVLGKTANLSPLTNKALGFYGR